MDTIGTKYTNPGTYRCETSAIRAIEARMIEGNAQSWLDELTDEQAVACAWVNESLNKAAGGDDELALSLFVAMIDMDGTFVATVSPKNNNNIVVVVDFEENTTQEDDSE